MTPSAHSKRMDQKYVAKAELTPEMVRNLKSYEKAALSKEKAILKEFDKAVEVRLGKRFLNRLRNTAKRRKMTSRQYARAVLCKPKGKK